MAVIQERKQVDGSITYRVLVRLKGFPTQSASFTRKTDAKKWAAQTESAIREGRHFKTVESKRHTLAQAIDRYIKNVLAKRPQTLRDRKRHLDWWKQQMGEYVLADINPALIAERRDQLASETTARNKLRSPATVNRYLAALSHLFTVAMKEWGWADKNPLTKVMKQKEPRGRVRFLSDDERSRLLQACEQSDSAYLYLIVILCLSTGARKMEIMNLTWDDVDFNRGVMTLHETKNGERRVLPLVGKAKDLLLAHASIKHPHSSLLFPSKYHNHQKPVDIRSAWERALEQAEIKDFRFHDLRHSAASYLAMNGATLAEIAEVLGHKTLQMVKRYTHLSEAHTAKIVSKMNEKIFG